jgi:hypothetical protein
LKNLVKYLVILFFAAVGLSACNPVDEEQLPPSNTANLTTDEAFQLLQGTWYLDRVEFLKGPTCAGGQNETFHHFTSDLMYPGYRMEFTDLVGDYLVGEFGGNSYQVYTDGGNSTRLYKLVNGMTGTCNGCENAVEGLLYGYGSYTENDLYLIHNGLTNAGIGISPNGSKIRVLNDQELVLEVSSSSAGTWINGDYSVGGKLVYFKRNSQSSLPRNQSNLHGVYKLDHYKKVTSGILETDEAIIAGPTIDLTDQVQAFSSEKRFKYVGHMAGWDAQTNSPYDFFSFGVYFGNDFYYETTNTHLCLWGLNGSFRLQILNPNEILLFLQQTCNDYEEYHLTKVN